MFAHLHVVFRVWRCDRGVGLGGGRSGGGAGRSEAAAGRLGVQEAPRSDPLGGGGAVEGQSGTAW